ncbi:hypothetical protein AB0G04_32660 [Actinoplanes sp. NPDC023801]|uniref:hypothetical protein n=1 Tax=Actinoplanes sp. NPDC023801 TaxID=3154595 RepID=UPI0033EA4254
MNQETLDQLIGAAPPSTLDVHDVIRRTRRRRRVRRALAGGSAATAVVAAFAVGAALVNGPQRTPVGPPPVAASVSAAPVPSPSPTGFALETSTRAGQERALGWLRTALEEAAARHAPGAKWIYMPDVPGEPRTPDGRPILLYTVDDDTFRGRSGITRDGRKGGFYLTLRPIDCAPGEPCQPMYECERGVADCRTSRTPAGLKMVRFVDRPGGKWLFYDVDVELPGGRYALHLNAVNYFGGDGSPAVAPAPVFTRAELAAIATEIAERVAG